MRRIDETARPRRFGIRSGTRMDVPDVLRQEMQTQKRQSHTITIQAGDS